MKINNIKSKNNYNIYLDDIRNIGKSMKLSSTLIIHASTIAHCFCKLTDKYEIIYSITFIFIALKHMCYKRNIKSYINKVKKIYNKDNDIVEFKDMLVRAELYVLKITDFEIEKHSISIFKIINQFDKNITKKQHKLIWIITCDVCLTDLIYKYNNKDIAFAILDIIKMFDKKIEPSEIHYDILNIYENDLEYWKEIFDK